MVIYVETVVHCPNYPVVSHSQMLNRCLLCVVIHLRKILRPHISNITHCGCELVSELTLYIAFFTTVEMLSTLISQLFVMPSGKCDLHFSACSFGFPWA